MRSWTRRAAVLAVCALSGCGGFGGDDQVTDQVTSPALLTNRQVDRYPAGSPQRVVFEWWRALQFDNPAVAATYYSRSLHMTPVRLDRMLENGASALGLTRRPKLFEANEHGDTATVLVLLEASTRNPNGRTDRTMTARGFNLVREDGEWKLAENLYLERQVRRLKRLFLRGVQQSQQTPKK